MYLAYIHTECPLNKVETRVGSMKEVKENKNILYHFVSIVNKLLIIKNRHISPAYWLMQARDEMRLPGHRGC